MSAPGVQAGGEYVEGLDPDFLQPATPPVTSAAASIQAKGMFFMIIPFRMVSY